MSDKYDIMKNLMPLLCLACLSLAACKEEKTAQADYQIVPLPKSITLSGEDAFTLSNKTHISYQDAVLKRDAELLSEYISDITGFAPAVDASGDAGIRLVIDSTKFTQAESYTMEVSQKNITITGSDASGVFYGIQTLRKSMPIGQGATKILFPCGVINDYPRFGYRGLHLDVCRHFMPLDSVKIYIDMMAMHDMNRFHLHISEDQGWRMEIKKYPELTKVGAFRSGTVIGNNSGVYDSIRHGGFYTQDELRDLVQYAADRHITIIPEIDLPGHMLSALASYPSFGCTGGPYEVWRQWGVSEDVICAGNEEALKFLEDVLNEVMDVFPSDIIHIGGDECPKTRWHECPKCQAKIKELGLKGDGRFTAEDYLQSYVMNRMENVVEARGRRIIGWDEILEGDPAQNAIVMSWRGIDGGIEAAKLGHDVVMAPNTYLYFDYQQTDDTENEPVNVPGYLPVERVYSFEPMPQELTAEQQKHIIGVQANIWTEHLPYFRFVEYNAMPRIAALAEIQWCLPEQRDYPDFVRRCFHLADLYDLYNFFYAHHIFDLKVQSEADTLTGSLKVTLSKYGDGDIHYTLDGSDPKQGQVYDKPLEIKDNCELRAVVMRPAGAGKETCVNYNFSKSSMKPIKLKTPPDQNYAFGGAITLVDALKGAGNYKTGRWIGFWGRDLDAIIDMEQPTPMSRVCFDADVVKGDWIYNPKSATVLVSDDGAVFKEVARDSYPVMEWEEADGVKTYELSFDTVTARYVEVVINCHELPKTHKGYGNPAWVFVDEIDVY